jgi:hypothetical protein
MPGKALPRKDRPVRHGVSASRSPLHRDEKYLWALRKAPDRHYSSVMAQSNPRIMALPPSLPDRPGRVVGLRGIILQSDAVSILGAWLIRPLETLDMHFAGLGRSGDDPSLAMHAGLHVVLEDGREFVVEQLFGTPREDFVDGLNWTPLETFRARDHHGWDVTVPAIAFREIDEDMVHQVIEFLNNIRGRPFFGEDCTTLIERAFGKRRLFADSPIARTLGFGMRVGDPALALLRRDVHLDPEAERLLRADFLRALPDPTTNWDAPNGDLWIQRILGFLAILAPVVGLAFYVRKRITGGKW